MIRCGIMFEQGDILLVPFPFSDLSHVKRRPVLVISNDAYNNRSEDVITCGITSNPKDNEYSMIINNENLIEGQIPKPSRIKIDKLFTLEKGIIVRKIARVKNNMLDKVKTIQLSLV